MALSLCRTQTQTNRHLSLSLSPNWCNVLQRPLTLTLTLTLHVMLCYDMPCHSTLRVAASLCASVYMQQKLVDQLRARGALDNSDAIPEACFPLEKAGR